MVKIINSKGQTLTEVSINEIHFIQIIDDLQYNWSLWLVRVPTAGEDFYEGTMEACPVDPSGFHSDVLELD